MMQSKVNALLPLAELKTGEHATLYEIRTEKGVARRMGSLGFTPGVDIVMTQNYGRGPLVVTLRGTRVALGREEARRAIVQRNQA
jgi:ferrous iron transport protein A